ncbi:S4 domain-containing protein [Parasphingorhabdus sp. JC815]|uniref:S4 domain-containing protein n=1 Tax=Parasphingorhabdus sp. JC815 TaxID=3232140 RepID=UPI0034595582
MKNRKAAETTTDPLVLRIDKLLWFLRFAGNRAMAKKLANRGLVRLNGRRVDRAHMMVRQGDILTIPKGREVHVIRIAVLPVRRGSAVDAESCFERLRTGE